MDEPIQISIAAPEMKSQDFALLREEGMQLIRNNASDTWTDHNLHDPGITLLEAACYAITEMGLRSGMPMRDLLASDASGRKQEFFTAAEILPMSPLTIKDLRKILIDHPLVENAWVFPVVSEPSGRLSVLLEFADDQLNSNTFSIPVGPNQVDIAFPYWDDTEALPFNRDVDIQLITFDTPFTLIEGSDFSYFARINVTYQVLPALPVVQKLWVVSQVTSPLSDPFTQMPPILAQLSLQIQALGAGTLLERFNTQVINATRAMRIVRRYLKDYRNLCEDFTEYKAVRLQEVALSAIIEINPGVIPENLLADIFFSIDQFIAPLHIFENLAAMQLRLSTDKIFEGPLLQSGFLPDGSLGETQSKHTIYASDLIRLILQHRDASGTDVLQQEDVTTRNIAAVRNLTISNYLDNRPIISNARDCLHLVESQRHATKLSLTKSRIVFFRNNVSVAYDLATAINIFNQKKLALLTPVDAIRDIPLPVGQSYPVSEYYPIQNDLPLIYGVGEAGLPETATTQRQALALQLKGYLFFFEQLTAGIAGQLSNLNSLFSADPDLEQTIFSQPLYHLPQIASLLKNYDPLTSWDSFINDPANGYITGLHQSAESTDEFLSRRNKILNHLLAILGEDMFDKGALAYRKASIVPNASSLSLADLLTVQARQQQVASRQLIRDKSAFLFDLPALNRDRAQSLGNPVWRTGRILQLQTTAAGINWTITDATGAPLLRSAVPAATEAACISLAAQTLSLATSRDNYTVVLEAPGQNRLVIMPVAALTPIAKSAITYATPVAANTGITNTIQTVVQLWITYGLTPLEERLYHMLSIAIKERRRLLAPVGNFFEIVPEPPGPGINKSFRFWENPGFTGSQLLVSGIYGAATDPLATAAAQAGIQTVISRGVRLENYEIRNPAPNTFQVVLLLQDGTVVARSPLNFATKALAETELQRIREHLYRSYSAEGFYMIEHFMLAPHALADAVLDMEQEDPYSFQVSFVFPSGYARDFSIVDGPKQPAQPENYRDFEFRKLAEEQIRKACPAHIMPRVFWVDRILPGSPVPVTDSSFDKFETDYLNWLTAWMPDDRDEAIVTPLRNTLVRTLNNIYADLSD